MSKYNTFLNTVIALRSEPKHKPNETQCQTPDIPFISKTSDNQFVPKSWPVSKVLYINDGKGLDPVTFRQMLYDAKITYGDACNRVSELSKTWTRKKAIARI